MSRRDASEDALKRASLTGVEHQVKTLLIESRLIQVGDVVRRAGISRQTMELTDFVAPDFLKVRVVGLPRPGPDLNEVEQPVRIVSAIDARAAQLRVRPQHVGVV